MARNQEANFAETFLGFLLVVAFCALIYGAHRFSNLLDRPFWKNIYLDFPSDGVIPMVLFVSLAGHTNNAAGKPRRPWLSSFIGLAGLTGLALAASRMMDFISHFDLCGGLLMWLGGVIATGAVLDSVLIQVWRNLFARDLTLAGRFMPLLGALGCLALLGICAWCLAGRYAARDYGAVPESACFVWGAICGIISGRRRSAALQSAAIA